MTLTMDGNNVQLVLESETERTGLQPPQDKQKSKEMSATVSSSLQTTIANCISSNDAFHKFKIPKNFPDSCHIKVGKP